MQDRCERYLAEPENAWDALLEAPFLEQPFRCLFYIRHDFKETEVDLHEKRSETDRLSKGQ